MPSRSSEKRPIRPRRIAALMALFAIVCALMTIDFYRDAKRTAIANLTETQRVHARQAAHGVHDFFDLWTSTLTALAVMDGVADADPAGRRTLTLFYQAHKTHLRSLTRVDENGVILAAYPSAQSAGKNIASQKHVAEVLRTRKRVVSDVFRSVQGFDAVALHVPVFEGARFRGSIAVVVDFQTLARAYFDDIRVGATSHAFVMSRDGTVLYGPNRNLVGKPALQAFRGNDEMVQLVERMITGGEGVATYRFAPSGSPSGSARNFYAVYEPIRLGNTFWSVVVATSEVDLLKGLNSFRDRLYLVIALVLIGGLISAIVIVRSWLAVNEERERRRADEAARASERLRGLMYDAVGDVLFYIAVERESELRFVSVNAAFLKATGLEEKDVIGKPVEVVIPGVALPKYLEAITSRKTVRWHETASLHAGTTEGEVSITPIFGADGTCTHLFATIHDVTEREALTRQMAELGKMEAIGTLAGGIAHDFNNILAVILSFATVAERNRTDDERFQKAITTIRQAVGRGAALARQVLTFARRVESTSAAIDVNELLAETLKMVQFTFPRTIVFETSLAARLPLVIADETQLHQAFLNILINARDAMPHGGTIEVTTTVVEGCEVQRHFPEADGGAHVSIRVRDSGTGIPDEVRERIFEPFFTTKELGRGTGLGLAVTYGAVKNAGGFIRVESEKDRGTMFEVLIPIPKAWTPSGAGDPDLAQELRGSESVLFVEDEPDIGPVMVETLREYGYTALLAHDGVEALEILERANRPIDVIVSDNDLPRMSGSELFAAMRQRQNLAPFILASGFVDPELLDSLRKAGIHELLQKPYTVDQLLLSIRTALSGSRRPAPVSR